MPQWGWIVLGAIVVIAVVAALILLTRSADRRRRNQTQRLKDRFGPEYERAVIASGGQRAAEQELLARERNRQRLDIVPLSAEARAKHSQRWRTIQSSFVDDPAGAVGEADRLVTRVMRERGYPVDDFDQAAADMSVDHPEVVERYRSARRTYSSQRQRPIDTEEQRRAVVDYRAVFDKLLETDKRLAVGKNNGKSQEARA